MHLIGVDVDSKLLVCERRSPGLKNQFKTFSNDPSGHKKFIQWASQKGLSARVCMEATGIYSTPFALALDAAPNIEVSVVNPRAIKNFAEAKLQRGKTDKMDAATITDFLERMDFRPWHPPRAEILELQYLTRRIIQLKTEVTRENNRLQTSSRLGHYTRTVSNGITVNIRHLKRRIDLMEKEVLALIESVPEIHEKFKLLLSIKGVGQKTASRMLAELCALPDDMSAKQWVAFAGLDPRPYESGTSTNKPRRISKAGNRYLRNALYFPALVAFRFNDHVKAFYEKLVDAGKKPIQALVAIMRKLLLAIRGMFKSGTEWDGNKFFKIA